MTPLEARIAEVFKEATLETEREPRFGFSDADGCKRAAVYRFSEFKQTGKPGQARRPLRWRFASACGTAIGGMLEEAARRLGDKTQAPAQLDDGLVKGSADWWWVEGDYVFDFKCKGETSWRKITSRPDQDEVRQVASYAKALGVSRWALIYIRGATCFEKGDGVEWRHYEGAALDSHADATVGFWRDVKGHLDAETIPDRPFGQDSFECRICRFKEACWEQGAL